MAEWKLNGDIPDISGLTATIDDIEAVLDDLAAALEIIAAALDVLAFLLIAIPNVLAVIVNALVNALEQTVIDFLQNNAALAVHTNMIWNPDWKPKRLPGDETRNVVDWVNDAALPWAGSGTNGWLLEVAYSAYDPTDPWRPLTDGDTDVRFGMMVIKGVPADGDFQELLALFEAFTDFGAVKEEWLKTKEILENTGEDFLAAMRMLGPGALWKKAQEIHIPIGQQLGEVYGTVIAEGTDGANDPGSTTFLLTPGGGPGPPGEDDFSKVQVGDTLRIVQTGLGTKLFEVTEVPDDYTLIVDPTILPDNSGGNRAWKTYRGGFISLQRELAEDLQEFTPGPGSFPKWISVPLAALLPGVEGFFDNVRKVADQLRISINQASLLSNLALLLREKAELLRKIVEELRELIQLIQAIIDFLTDSYVFVYTSDSGDAAETGGGGINGFVNAAIAADNKPDFGTRGVVIGMVVLAVTDEPSNHLEEFWKLVGLEVDSFKAGLSERDEALDETWGDLFPPP